MVRFDSNFLSNGTNCSGWLYIPDNVNKPPVVIMAHGFGAEKTFRLPAFAEYFTNRGLAVYIFDYRGFGNSDGKPRQWVSPRRHLQDWAAAINHVSGLHNLDTERMALWGSSFSGGHVLVTAARNSGIKAVVSQVPALDGFKIFKKYSIQYSIKAIFHFSLDIISSLILRKPHYIPIISEIEKFAILNKSDSLSGYLKIVPDGYYFHNKCLARALITSMFYRPILFLHKISCPVLIILAEQETLYDVDDAIMSLKKFKNIKTISLPAGHFDVYVNEPFKKAVKVESDFLITHLKNKINFNKTEELND